MVLQAATMEREKKKKGMGKKFSFAKNKDSSRTEVTVSNDDCKYLGIPLFNVYGFICGIFCQVLLTKLLKITAVYANS